MRAWKGTLGIVKTVPMAPLPTVLRTDVRTGPLTEGVLMMDPLLHDRLLEAWRTLEAWCEGGSDDAQ